MQVAFITDFIYVLLLGYQECDSMSSMESDFDIIFIF